MRRRPEVGLALLLVAAPARAAEPPPGQGLFDVGSFRSGSKEPITVTSDTLEYDYRKNVVVYRGQVVATQGPVKIRSDHLTVSLDRAKADAAPSGAAADAKGAQRLRDIVAVGHVRIDHGTRWATGGKAVFDQTQRTLVLSEDPVLHDGANEVAGDRVVVYLDEDRSVVEGGRKRVKAVLYPDKDGGLAPAGGSAPAAPDAAPPAPSASAAPLDLDAPGATAQVVP